MAARLAIARAQRQLAQDADVHLHTRNFSVINQVGAVSLKATLNCEAFADAHRASAHYDQSSFVGLAWRPEGESCCVEIYSTGRANLPGSRTERALNASFYRMLPELLRFSSRSRLLEMIPEELKAVHRTRVHGPHMTRPAHVAAPHELMEGWVTSTDGVVEELGAEEEEEVGHEDGAQDDFDDGDLAALGL